MSTKWRSWSGFVYYGEAVGFVAAWVIGVAAIVGSKPAPVVSPTADQLAAVSPTNR